MPKYGDVCNLSEANYPSLDISNYMPSEAWDEFTYPFPNFKGSIIEIWELLSHFISYSITDVITYPWWD